MNQTNSKKIRILALALSARGFGYSVMENQVILECGNKGVKGNKNLHSVSKIERLMKQFIPGVLILQDVTTADSRRAPRIRALHEEIIRLAKKHKCAVALYTTEQLRIKLLGNKRGTKYEMAELLALKYPVELAGKLPRKRRPWENEDGRMDMFDAMGLAVVFLMKAM